jgi:AbiV family abortive infection protein
MPTTGQEDRSKKVNAEFVVEGVARAALNAKRFVEDSLLLYSAKRLGSASIIAVIAIENVGRAKRMLQTVLENAVDPGTGQFPVKSEIEREQFLDSIRSAHEPGIRTGIEILQFASTSPVDMSDFNARIQDLQQYPKHTPEHPEVVKRLKRALKKVFDKTTTGFHVTRTIEQYVEPDDECTVWNETQDAPEQRVRDLIVNAKNNYNLLVARITGNKRMMDILQQKGLADQLTPLPTADFLP